MLLKLYLLFFMYNLFLKMDQSWSISFFRLFKNFISFTTNIQEKM